VVGEVIVVFRLLISAPTGGTAATAASFAALIAAANAVDYAGEDGDYNH